MNPIIMKEGKVSYGLNGVFIDKVLDLRNKGIKSHFAIAGLSGVPISYVNKILKTNRR